MRCCVIVMALCSLVSTTFANQSQLALGRIWFAAAQRRAWDEVPLSSSFLLCERTYHYQSGKAFHQRRRQFSSRRAAIQALRTIAMRRAHADDYVGATPRQLMFRNGRYRNRQQPDSGTAQVLADLERCSPPKGTRVYRNNDTFGVDYPDVLVVVRDKHGWRVAAWLHPDMLCDEDPC